MEASQKRRGLHGLISSRSLRGSTWGFINWALNRRRVLAGGQRPPEEGECTKAEVKVLAEVTR